jgi:hypothetical protein
MLLALASGRLNAGAPAAGDKSPTGSGAPFETDSPILQASLDRIARGSALWREATDAVRLGGRRIVLITPYGSTPWASKSVRRSVFAGAHLAEAVPLLRSDARVSVVLIFVNLPLIQDAHNVRFSAPLHFESDLDRILVHEIYGHAIPYLRAGDLSGQCADPRRNEPPAAACAIQRENAVRSELGLGQRADRGLSSLSLGHGRVLPGH